MAGACARHRWRACFSRLLSTILLGLHLPLLEICFKIFLLSCKLSFTLELNHAPPRIGRLGIRNLQPIMIEITVKRFERETHHWSLLLSLSAIHVVPRNGAIASSSRRVVEPAKSRWAVQPSSICQAVKPSSSTAIELFSHCPAVELSSHWAQQ